MTPQQEQLEHLARLWMAPDGQELWAGTERAMRVRLRIAR
jgi:hypothetical protein